MMGQFKSDFKKRDDMIDLSDGHEFGASAAVSTRLSSYKRILAVDDSKLIRRMVARSLIVRGYEVDEAEDGVEALEMMNKSSWSDSDKEQNTVTVDTGMMTGNNSHDDFSKSTYDVILMDSEMPRMCGPIATEWIRAHGYKGVIVALTGNVRQEEKDLFMSKGATRVLFKPIDILQLDQALKEIEEANLRNK